jgi:hypothetical protein
MSFAKILYIPILISVGLLAIFVTVELRFAKDPIIPISVLKSRGALLSCIAQLGIMAARWMVLFYTPAYAIAILGWSPASAGSILIPTNLGFAIGGVVVGWLHIKRGGSFWLYDSSCFLFFIDILTTSSACVLSYVLFALTLLLLALISVPSTPPPLYFLSVFLNGLCTGAALNYTLAHLLHLTPPSTHFISTSLLTTFRGFAGSFGSGIGGGLFIRVLKSTLEKGFEENGGLAGRKNLVRRLLGSPALVQSLKGVEKSVAIAGYISAFRALFLSGVGLAAAMVFVQAGTGWAAPKELVKVENAPREEGGLLGVVEDEEWEEGMERGA